MHPDGNPATGSLAAVLKSLTSGPRARSAVFVLVLGVLLWGVVSGASARAATTSRSSPSQGSQIVESGARRENPLTIPKAVVLGVVEGLTEYLPVSSTGHLLVVERLIGLDDEADKSATDTFTIAIQIGAILAVLGIFRHRFVVMAEGLVGRSAEGRNLVLCLIIAFVPAGIIAKLFDDAIKDHLLRPWPVVVTWAVGGLVILVFVRFQDRWTKVRTTQLGAITTRQAAIIGIAQVLAFIPGTSRSLVTLLAGLLVGLSLTVAVEFAFLLGFVTLGVATGYELITNGSELFDRFGVVSPVIGIIVAGIAAFASVKWMITYLERHPLTIFGWYRLGIAAVVAVLLATGAI